MAQEKFGPLGWALVIFAGYVVLQKKGVAQGNAPLFLGPPTPQQISTGSQLPSNAVAGSDSYTAWVQDSLNHLIGANLAVDGIIGPLTRAAIMQFQSVWQIPQTGIVDPETDWDLRAALGQHPYVDQPYASSSAMIVSGEY